MNVSYQAMVPKKKNLVLPLQIFKILKFLQLNLWVQNTETAQGSAAQATYYLLTISTILGIAWFDCLVIEQKYCPKLFKYYH